MSIEPIESSEVVLMVYRGHIRNGQIVLDGQARLPEGAAVRVDVLSNGEGGPERGPQDARPRAAWDRLLELSGTLRGLPPDASENLDRYLYDATEP
jgi:hypothetical protein